MLIIRKYKKLGWFDLLDKMEEVLTSDAPKERYFEFVDELRMRLIESVSEGASFKIKAPTNNLIELFSKRREADSNFATELEEDEFRQIASDILR